MYSKMRFRRRRKSARRIIVPICLIFVGALVIVIGSSLATGTRAQRMGIPLAPVIEAPVSAANTAPSEMGEPTDASSQVNGKWYGLCAKNSSRSVEDMRRIVQSDPVLVNYFADVDWNKATAEKLQEPASVYVAYRKNDVIRYTTRRIHLPRGEPYITDGKRNIKSSCCNDFVDEPPGPKAQNSPGLTSIPAAPPPSLVESIDPGRPNGSTGPIASMQPLPEGHSPPPLYYPSSGGGSRSADAQKLHSTPPSEKPVPVPEPGTLMLFGSGLFGICIMEMIRRRRK